VNVCIVGCGLIGQKRAKLLGSHRLVAAVEAGKHVLVEKPAARNSAELLPVVEAARKSQVVVKVGFNHRFHPAMQQAREYIDKGALGELMFIRGRYGHGGRVGYDKEWRANPAVSGGGELLDQGMHLIDLSRWFLGDFTNVEGFTRTYFWDMPVDDNAFMMLRTAREQMAFLHVSWTEWKNVFSLEIYGKIGKLHIEGLGGSYGTERLSYYKMSPEMGPPDTFIHEYPGADRSWEREFFDFVRAVETKKSPSGNLEDALMALRVVDNLYGVTSR
jgi:predicted dehydrogenase